MNPTLLDALTRALNAQGPLDRPAHAEERRAAACTVARCRCGIWVAVSRAQLWATCDRCGRGGR